MARYLVTVSWVDPKQKLRRLKHTQIIYLTLGDSEREILENIQRQTYGNCIEDIAVDFMIKLE